MIRVAIVEDDPLTAELHTAYVERLDGFEVVGSAGNAREARKLIGAADAAIDLVLLDLTLPDIGGLDLARAMRSAGLSIDIIAVTAVRDIAAVQTAMSFGAVQYLIKPFTFQVFQEKLLAYAAYRSGLSSASAATSQAEIDRLLAVPRSSSAAAALPKGLTAATLDAVSRALRESSAPLSAAELAERGDLSRVTARRYLEHLADIDLASREPRYGTPGRPEVAYRWLSHPSPDRL